MALRVGFSSCSLGASVDQQTGHLSVFEVVEEVLTPQVPVHLQNLVLTLSFEKTTQEKHQGKVFIHHLLPDSSQRLIGNGALEVPSERRRMKAVFRFGGFPVTQFGAHRIVVSWMNDRGDKEGEVLFDFDVIQVTQVAQGVPPTDKKGTSGGPEYTH